MVGDNNPDKEKIVAEYQSRLRGSLNNKNMGQYVKAFMNRKDLSLKGCKVDILLITGMLSPYATVVEKLHRDVDNKEKVTMLKIERAGDVLADTVSFTPLYSIDRLVNIQIRFIVYFHSQQKLPNQYCSFVRDKDN